MDSKELENLTKYFFEVGQLKSVKRSGWWLAGVKDPESVAEHSHRTSIIAFLLAKIEGEDAGKLCAAGAFHDVLECRILDLHKIVANYIDYKPSEAKVINDQLSRIPEIARSAASDIILELNPKEKKILKDADYLECALQAKTYFDLGYKSAWDWIERIENALYLESSKTLAKKIKETDSNSWWQGLKKPVSESFKSERIK